MTGAMMEADSEIGDLLGQVLVCGACVWVGRGRGTSIDAGCEIFC